MKEEARTRTNLGWLLTQFKDVIETLNPTRLPNPECRRI